MKTIELSKGQVAIVDDEDFELVNQFYWHARPSGEKFYVQKRPTEDSPDIYLHRFLMKPPAYLVIDHVNGNPLDNRRENLRLATQAENMRNRGPCKTSLTGYRGVTWDKRRRKFTAQLTRNDRNYHLGRYATAEEAARAVDDKRAELDGEFAWLNFPKTKERT